MSGGGRLPTMTLPRFVLALLVLWLVLGVAALVLFSTGGTAPGSGMGDPVELTA